MRNSLPVLLLLLCAVPAARGQSAANGRIEGVITDSAHAGPAVGAVVMVTRLAPEPSLFVSGVTDGKGRFRFDTLAAGRYFVSFATEFLDSLGLLLPERAVTLGPDQHVAVELGVPSPATLKAAGCPGLQLAKDQGAVIGQVTDADTDRPLLGARVAVSWSDLSVDKATLQPATQLRVGAVPVDSLGRYRLCGVPVDTYLLVQVQRDGRAGSTLRLSVSEAGILVRDLSFSAEASRSIAALDSAAAAAAAPVSVRLLTGTATISGTVRGVKGQPLAAAQVRVLDAEGSTRSDSLGRFTLSGLPGGTQLLETRHIGYLLSQLPVELRSGKSIGQEVSLARIASLDSIRIVARRSRYREFESRAGRSGFGRFFDEQEIEKRHAFETTDLLRTIPGFRIEGSGLDARVVSSRGAISFRPGPCATNIVIDGMQHQEINLLVPSDIGAMEAYPSPSGAPMQYDASCGVIVLWTKR
jgi:hypothetical protein